MLKGKKNFFLCFSFVVASLGQPAWVPALAVLCAAFGYGLFWYGLSIGNDKKSYLLPSFIFFLGVQLVQLSWMSSIQYQGWYIVVVYLLLSAFLAFQFAILTRYVFSRAKSSFLFCVAVASFAVLLEWSRLFVFCGFSFNFAGIALGSYPISMQFASVFGVLGLSFLVWLSNVLFFWVCKSRWSPKVAISWGAVALFPYVFSAAYLFLDEEFPNIAPLHVLLIQTGLTPSEKMPLNKFSSDYINPLRQWERIYSMVLASPQRNIELVVLPESSVSFSLQKKMYPLHLVNRAMDALSQELRGFYPSLNDSRFAEKRGGGWFVSNAFFAKTLANYLKAEVIAGFDDEDVDVKENYNAAFCFDPESNSILRYEKRVLLPLAEVLPWSFLQRFTRAYGITDFFTPGKSAKIFTKHFQVGVSICIEEMFPEVMRETRKQGAKVFVNLTNDAWYPRTNLPYQHFSHGRLRSVENGVPMLRACNTGVTAVVSHTGEVLKTIDWDSWLFQSRPGVLFYDLPLKSKKTLYTLWGDSGILILSMIALLFTLRLRDEGEVF